MRTLDAVLSRRAQQMLGDPSALIYRGTAHTDGDRAGQYVLERQGCEPLALGDTGGLAYQALIVLRAERRARLRKPPEPEEEQPDRTDLREAEADIRYHQQQEDGI